MAVPSGGGDPGAESGARKALAARQAVAALQSGGRPAGAHRREISVVRLLTQVRGRRATCCPLASTRSILRSPWVIRPIRLAGGSNRFSLREIEGSPVLRT